MPSWTAILQKSPEGHRIRGLGTLFCHAFSPDGGRIATGGNLGVVVWDIRARRVLGRAAREVAPVVSIAFSRDGRRIAALGQDGAIALCDASTFETIAVVGAMQEELDGVMDGEDAPRLQFGADAETLLVIGDECSLLVSGKKAKLLTGDALPEWAGGEVRERPLERVGLSGQWIVSPNGDLLASGDSYYGKLSFRDMEGREPFPPLGRYIYDSDSAVALSIGDAGASHAVIAGFIGDGQNSSTWVQFFDLVEDRPGAVVTESAAFFLNNIAFVPGAHLAAVPLDSGGLVLGDMRSGETRILKDRDGYQNAAVGMNGAIVASGSANGYLTFWDRESGRVLASVRAHEDQICGLDWQPNGDLLASSSQDGTVRFWSAKAILSAGKIRDESDPDDAREEPVAVASIGDMLYRVVFSPDGQHCAVGMAEGAACVIRASDGTIVRRVGKHRAEVMALAFHPRTAELVTGSSDGTLSVWKALTGECVFSYSYKGKNGDEDGMSGVTGLGFDAAGSVLAISHMDGTIRVWDI